MPNIFKQGDWAESFMKGMEMARMKEQGEIQREQLQQQQAERKMRMEEFRLKINDMLDKKKEAERIKQDWEKSITPQMNTVEDSSYGFDQGSASPYTQVQGNAPIDDNLGIKISPVLRALDQKMGGELLKGILLKRFEPETSMTEAQIAMLPDTDPRKQAALSFYQQKSSLTRDNTKPITMQSDIGKLQADKEYYLKQGLPVDHPTIKAIDDEMRKKSTNPVDAKIEKERLAAVGRNDRLDFELDRLETAATKLLNHPGRIIGTGKSAIFNVVPGTSGYDFKVAANQLGNMLQLDTMTAMREASKTGGLMGNLSDREGQVLRGYVAELDTLQSEKQYEDWINKVIQYTHDLRQKTRETLEKQFPSEATASVGTKQPTREEAIAELRRRGKIK